jgi:hypothetical protein
MVRKECLRADHEGTALNQEPRQRRSLRELLSDLWAFRLFWLTLGVAGVLIALVTLAPMFDNSEEAHAHADRVIAVFARDSAMRQTAFGAALGLVVTACVFFRTPRAPRPPRTPRASSPSGPVIGA